MCEELSIFIERLIDKQVPLSYFPSDYLNKEILIKIIKYDYKCRYHQLPKKLIDEDVLKELIIQNPGEIQVIPKKYLNYNLCKLSVENYGILIGYIPKRFINKTIVNIALEQDLTAVIFLPNNLKHFVNDKFWKMIVLEKEYYFLQKYLPDKYSFFL